MEKMSYWEALSEWPGHTLSRSISMNALDEIMMWKVELRVRPPGPRSTLLGGGLVGGVGQVERSGPATAVVLVVVVWDLVGDDLVALVLVAQELLQGDDGAEDQGDLADDQGLEGQEGQTSEGDGDQSGGLKFQEQEDGQEGFHDLLLLATG